MLTSERTQEDARVGGCRRKLSIRTCTVLPSTPFPATNASLTHSLRFGWAIPPTSSLSAVSHLSISRIFPKFRLSALKRRTRRDVYTTRFFVNKGLLPLTHLTTKEYLPHPSRNSLTRLCAWACHMSCSVATGVRRPMHGVSRRPLPSSPSLVPLIYHLFALCPA